MINIYINIILIDKLIYSVIKYLLINSWGILVYVIYINTLTFTCLNFKNIYKIGYLFSTILFEFLRLTYCLLNIIHYDLVCFAKLSTKVLFMYVEFSNIYLSLIE